MRFVFAVLLLLARSAHGHGCAESLAILHGNFVEIADLGVPVVLVDTTGYLMGPAGRFVEGTTHVYWTTLPEGGLPQAAARNLAHLEQLAAVAKGTGANQGPLAALAQLRAMGAAGNRNGVRFEVSPPMVVDAAALASATDTGRLFQQVYDAYRGATSYDSSTHSMSTPFELQVRGANGQLRSLDMSVPRERELGLFLFRLSVEEALHHVCHQARGYGQYRGNRSFQLLTPQAQAFAEWMATQQDAVARYYPELQERYGREPSMHRMAGTLAEADVTAWLANQGLPHTPTEIGGRDGRVYQVRRLFELYMRDVYRPPNAP